MAKIERTPLKYNFINPNTQEETVDFLAKLLPEIIYHNQFKEKINKKSKELER